MKLINNCNIKVNTSIHITSIGTIDEIVDNEIKNRINAIKFFVAILVVFAHCTRMFTINSAIQSNNCNNILFYVTKYIYGFHMPLFFLLSGFVYSICISHGKYKNRKQFIKKKFYRLLIPYIIFGALYVAPVMISLKITNDNYLVYLIKGIILGNDSRHLWFLPTLFGIFVIASFIRPSDKKNTIISFFMGTALLLVSIKVIFLPSYIYSIFRYLIYFYIGYCLYNYYNILKFIENKKNFKNLICLFLIIIYSIMYILQINVVILEITGVMAFFFLFYCISSLFSTNEVLKKITKYGMGIYLLHPMIIYLLFYYSKNLEINVYLNCFIIFFIAFFTSLLLSITLSKTKIKWVLG